MRTVLVHLNIDVPADDPRDADEIADTVVAALDKLGLEIVAPLAEEA